jgi:UDP-N-acetylmuramoyl-L-alanyl-D-glutamate--2,6-diaminopimelate ligase
MLLIDLISSLDYKKVEGDLKKEIKEIVYDSRYVKPESLFVAIRGQKADGNLFINQAIENGAVAILTENVPVKKSKKEVSWIEVKNCRYALALLANTFYQYPSRELKLIGITGTNGKTTVAYLLQSILQAAGVKCGRLGTISYHIGDKEIQAKLTTPEAVDIQRYLREMQTAGCEACVMEASSHSLVLHRVEGCDFDVAIFTNFAREHLDFHKDMEDYFAAKKSLFYMLNNKPEGVVAINLDDSRGEELLKLSKNKCVTFALDQEADIKAVKFHLSAAGNELEMNTPLGSLEVKSPLIGKPNISNILAASAAAIGMGIKLENIKKGIESLSYIPGRFEKIEAGQDFMVIDDFAHSGDALKRLLESLRHITKGKLIIVFGCGGERDKGKRPLMGYYAALLSDIAIVTSDNPRSEDPMQIMKEVEEGIERANPQSNYMLILDRREAIKKAIEIATKDDVVVIAGKGHETYQLIGDKVIPWSDKDIAEELIMEKMAGS